jgi:hypothetical protein
VGWDDVDGSADCAVAPVRREDNDGGDTGFERAMKVGKALPEEKKANSSTGEIRGHPRLRVSQEYLTLMNWQVL